MGISVGILLRSLAVANAQTTKTIIMRDACDPATFDAAVGPGTCQPGHLRLRHTHQLLQNKAGRFGGPAGIRTPDQGIMSPLL